MASSRRATRVAGRRLESLRPVPVLGALVLVQLAIAAWFVFNTPHNGWIWYSGGDSTQYWTEAWGVGHFIVPPAAVGYALPVFYAWVPLVAGPSLLTGAVVIVLLQMLVLVPLAVVLFWCVADRLFGRVYAWVAALLWVAGPLLLLHGFVPSYHANFDQLFLAPHWFGATNMADLPSLVAILACAWITLRAVDTGSPTDALIGGLLGGLAIGLKPSDGFFLPAVAVLLLGARRPRQTALWAGALIPAVLTLAIWKFRGLGYLPLTSASYQQLHEAAGTATHPLGFATSKYLQFDIRHLHSELLNLREVFWSLRFLEFLVVAGVFGVIRRSTLKGAFVVVWFAAFCIFKASTPLADFPSATYFRLAEPGLPAFILLVVGVAFCLPGLRPTRTAAVSRPAPGRIDLRRLVPAGIVLAILPLAVVLAIRSPSSLRIVRNENLVQEAPQTRTLDVVAKRGPKGSVTLTWRTPAAGGTRPWFIVYGSPHDDGCAPITRGTLHCKFNTMPAVKLTNANQFVDRPGLGRHWYRVAVVADYRLSAAGGDMMLISNAVEVPPS